MPRADFEIRAITPADFAQWDEFVAASPQGSVYHTSYWKRVMDEAYRGEIMSLTAAFQRDRIVAGATALTRERLGQRIGVTPLLTPYSGPITAAVDGEKISDRSSHLEAVSAALADHLRREYAFQNYNLSPGWQDTRPLAAAGFTLTPRFTYVLDLSRPPEETWRNFDGHVRRQIKKAERLEYELRDTLPQEQAYEIFADTFQRRKETCPVSAHMFRAVTASPALAAHRTIVAAYRDGQLCSYIVALHFGATLYYSIAATQVSALSSGVSSFLVWELIRRHSGGAWQTFDFVGANIPSIARFKEGFNPQLVMHLQAEHWRDSLAKLGKQMLDKLRG